LGWGYFILEAEIVLKEPYSWVVDNSGARQAGLELSWRLDFRGDGRQGRVRAKVKKMEDGNAAASERAARVARRTQVDYRDVDEDDEEEDEDWEDEE
jgi:hypothetical protein